MAEDNKAPLVVPQPPANCLLPDAGETSLPPEQQMAVEDRGRGLVDQMFRMLDEQARERKSRSKKRRSRA